MKVVIGLGNPGIEYQNTRHNIGFMVIDALAEEYKIRVDKSKFKGLLGEGTINSEKIILVKPLTYMNLSGYTVQAVVNWYKVDLADLLIIYDDLSLPLGQLRFRPRGSSGGHNGIKSILSHLGDENFPRLKIGIGKELKGSTVNHVLGRFSKEEQSIVDNAIDKSVQAVNTFIAEDINTAMNKFN